MFVDDQEANVRLLERILRRGGMERITGLTDSRRAIEVFATARPDLLLVDLHMPHLDGFGIAGVRGVPRPRPHGNPPDSV